METKDENKKWKLYHDKIKNATSFEELDSLFEKPLLGKIFNTEPIIKKIQEYKSMEEYCYMYCIKEKALQNILYQIPNVHFKTLIKIAVSLDTSVKNLFL